MSRLMEWLLRLKPGELGGADSWAPRFAAGYNNWVILALVVVFGGLVVLTVLCYLREGDHPRRVKLTVAVMRILAIVLVMAMLLEPGLVLRYRKNLHSTLVVLLDDSLSMSLKDRYPDPVLREALARGLGVDPDSLAELSRTEIVRRILAREGGPLAELAREHPLVLLRFSTAQPGRESYTRPLAVVDHTAAPEGDRELAAAAAKEITQVMAELTAGGYETNLAAALRDAAERLQGRRVSGIVLVSDGQVTAGTDAAGRLGSAISLVRQRGIPVFAVAVGDPQPPQNVAVLRLQGPAEVRKGSTIELTAYLAQRNLGGKSVELVLLKKPADGDRWSPTDVRQTVALKGAAEAEAAEAQEVRLNTEASDLGEFVYKAEIAPLDGEFSAEDNSATAKVRISEEKVKILLLSADGGWEFQYLRNLLLRSPERYAVSVWQQDADLEFNQEASTGMRLSRLPRTKPELYNYEVVILYDPAYTKEGFDKEFVDLLEDFVAEHHGGLCYIASNKHTDGNLASRPYADSEGGDAPGDPFRALRALLPVELGRLTLDIAERIARGEDRPWPAMPTVVGMDHPALRLGRTDEETLGIWRGLPGTFWCHPVIRLKPLASSLAVSTDPMNRTADGSGEPTPLIAVQYYGKGRSVYMGFDETWRWRYVADGMFHRRFWQNLVDFLAAGRLEKKRILVTTGGDRFAVGEDLRVRVEAYDRNYKPLEDETLEVEMIDAATKKVQKVTLQRDPKKKGGGNYEGTVPLRAVGTFELTTKRDDPAYKDDVAGKTITVTLPEEEFRHPEADLATLQTIAPEGRFLMIHEGDRLKGLIPSGKMSVFNEVPHPLWDVPLAIVVIVLLLGSEWILRKKYNMA